MIPYDKRLHVIVGFLISLIGYYLFSSLLAGFWLAVLAGILKEIRDKITGKGTPEILDIIATAAGGYIPTASYDGYTPYKMIYQLATPVVTELGSNEIKSYYPTTLVDTEQDNVAESIIEVEAKVMDS